MDFDRSGFLFQNKLRIFVIGLNIKNTNFMAIEFKSGPVLTGESARRFQERLEMVDRLPEKELPEGFYQDLEECIERSRKFVREHEALGFQAV